MATTTAAPAAVALDTTEQSVLHFLTLRFLHDRSSKAPSAWWTPLCAVMLTYLPLLLFAWVTAPSIMHTPRTTTSASQVMRTPQAAAPTPTASQSATCVTVLHVPFLRDWNVLFMFTVTFPVLVTLAVRDQGVLVSAIGRVRADGVLILSEDKWNALCACWNKRFRSLNIVFQLIGLGTGIAVACGNYTTYVKSGVGYWIAPAGVLLPVGWLYLFYIFLFYIVTAIYILRSVAISFLLWDLATVSTICVLPLHPDRSGGLRPVGAIGLRNQYALTVVGINVVILKFIAVFDFSPKFVDLNNLILAALTAYLVCSPLLFIGPLVPFRAAMLNTRAKLMNEVAKSMRIEIDTLLQQLRDGKISQQNEDMVDRLSKLGSVIEKLPVWPFDLQTMQKFLTAYVTPALGAILVELGKKELLPPLQHLLGF